MNNARGLSVLCIYDTGQHTGFNTGILEIDGALVFSTEYDMFSINPITCRENWRIHENYRSAYERVRSKGPTGVRRLRPF
jgi:alcohol dehydrogenase (cytochrome c)